MNFLGSWNEERYQELLNYLKEKQDLKYKEFYSKIICSDNLIGVRTEELKKIAKEIAKGDYQSFLQFNKSTLNELIMI